MHRLMTYDRLADVARFAPCAGACLLVALFGAPALAADQPARARLLATIDAGDRIVEQSRALDPIRQRQREENERLAEAEKALQAEWSATEREIKAYNAAQKELAEALRQHRQKCPDAVQDDNAIEACNQGQAALDERGNALEQKRTEIAARQQDLNARIAQHNAAREAWLATKRQDTPRLAASAADVRRWLSNTRAYMLGTEFDGLLRQAASPGACTALNLNNSTAHFGVRGIEELEACLKLVAKYTK